MVHHVKSMEASMARHVKSMEVSTGGVLSLKSISYSQDLVLAKIFWKYFSFHRIFVTWVFLALQRLLLLEYGGGPEKDRDVCVFVVEPLCILSLDSSCQLDVPWHDGNSPGVNGTQVGVIK